MRLPFVGGSPAAILHVAAALLLGSACATQRSASEVKRTVVAAQQALITANNAADVIAVEHLTADDWIGVEASGVSRTKAQIRERIGKRGAALIQATPAQLAERQKSWQVRVYDDVAIVTRLTAGDHGSPSWITTVWVRREGRWQSVLSQVTTAAENSRPLAE